MNLCQPNIGRCEATLDNVTWEMLALSEHMNIGTNTKLTITMLKQMLRHPASHLNLVSPNVSSLVSCCRAS